MLTSILALIGQMDPLWVVLTVIIGVALGFLSKDIEFEWKSIYLLLLFYIPFAVARGVALILAGIPAISGSGALGAVFFFLYLIVFIVGRKIGRRIG